MSMDAVLLKAKPTGIEANVNLSSQNSTLAASYSVLERQHDFAQKRMPIPSMATSNQIILKYWVYSKIIAVVLQEQISDFFQNLDPSVFSMFERYFFLISNQNKIEMFFFPNTL